MVKLTLEYQIIGEFEIIGVLETFPKINNRGIGIIEGFGVGVRGGSKKIFTLVSETEVKLTSVI